MDNFDPYDPPLINDSFPNDSMLGFLHSDQMPEYVPDPIIDVEIPSTSYQTTDNTVEDDTQLSLSSTSVTVESVGLSPKSTSSSTKRLKRRTYEPDPIRGTNEHVEKRARNNEAVRKSRAKASKSVQEAEQMNLKNEQDAALYRDARLQINEIMKKFKDNIFDRSPQARLEQKKMTEEVYRINESLREGHLDVPTISEALFPRRE